MNSLQLEQYLRPVIEENRKQKTLREFARGNGDDFFGRREDSDNPFEQDDEVVLKLSHPGYNRKIRNGPNKGRKFSELLYIVDKVSNNKRTIDVVSYPERDVIMKFQVYQNFDFAKWIKESIRNQKKFYAIFGIPNPGGVRWEFIKGSYDKGEMDLERSRLSRIRSGYKDLTLLELKDGKKETIRKMIERLQRNR